MRQPGQVALMRFPQVDLMPGKPRPVLLIARVPGPYDDGWSVCSPPNFTRRYPVLMRLLTEMQVIFNHRDSGCPV